MTWGALSVCLLLLTAPLFMASLGAPGAQGAFPPLPPLPPILIHQNVEVVSNFSSMHRMNLELRPDGGLELSRGGALVAMDEVKVSPANATDPLQDVAVDRYGQSIVVWDDGPTVGGDVDVFIQRYDRAGRLLGARMSITGPKTHQSGARVAVTSNGGFIVAYQAKNLSDLSVYAQRYDANGTTIGSAIAVSEPTGGGAFPDIAVVSRDGFIITWWDERSGLGDIYARRYDAAGNPAGAEIEVYAGATNEQVPCIALLPRDRFVIAWSSIVNGTYDIMAQRFDASGNKLGVVIPVNAAPQDGRFPAICANSFGEFTIAYDRIFSKTVMFQRYDQNGSKLGSEVKSPGPAGNAFYPQLAATSNDGFAMAWEIELVSPNAETFIQRYDRTGAKLGGAMQLSASVVYGADPDIAVGPDDGMTVLWQNYSAWDKKTIMLRQLIFPFAPSGILTTGPIAPPDLWSWLKLGENASYEDAGSEAIGYECSENNGTTWAAVPENGSLAGASHSPSIRIRATLSSVGRSTTPVLYSLKLSYIYNRVPGVLLPDGFSAVKGTPVLVRANGTDGDRDPLAYSWDQTGGPPAAFNSSAPDLSFTPAVSGNYSFRVTVSDFYNTSAPAFINITVVDSPPDLAVLQSEITLSPKRPGAGKMTTVSVVVRNIGESNASLFKVRFLMDGSPLDEQDLGVLVRNGSSSLSASWKARAGTHNFTVKVDSGSTVTELREDNNEASVTFKVAAASSVEAGFPWFVVILLIIAITAVVAVVMFVRRRKPVTVIQYQPPTPQPPPPAVSSPLPPTPPIPQAPPADAPSPLPSTPPIPPSQPSAVPPSSPPPPA